MVKHTQAILRQQPTNCLNVLDHFVGLSLKGLTLKAAGLFKYVPFSGLYALKG